jgi:uncharacterized protein (DUF952 family)
MIQQIHHTIQRAKVYQVPLMGSQTLLYVQNRLLLLHTHPAALDQALRWRLTQQPLCLGSWH